MSTSGNYVDLTRNGKLFPQWVIENFRQYKLPDVIVKDNEDPCNVEVKKELYQYQTFASAFISPMSPYNAILLYHGLGSGKTATCINLINVFHNYDTETNVVILIKASLREDPWEKELKKWLEKYQEVYKQIHFVHYNSPYADKQFTEIMKSIDYTKRTLYFIDEVHNFINNVYSNIKAGTRRAYNIYNFIVTNRTDYPQNKLVLVSATPGINEPFELALTFNMMKPGIFPNNEAEFERFFVTKTDYPTLNPHRRNLFMRRILGLVSYYSGANPNLFAKKELQYVNLPMSKYQYSVYQEMEQLEDKIESKSSRFSKKKETKLYKTYTRQACNFVFPIMDAKSSGINRPRPNKFGLKDTSEKIDRGGEIIDDENIKQYFDATYNFVKKAEKYFQEIKDKDTKITIEDDLKRFKDGFSKKYDSKFINFYLSDEPKSELTHALYECGPKMLAIVFLTFISPGKVMVYSNYVLMEGIDMLKVYYKMIGFDDYKKAKSQMGFCEYHGRMDKAERLKNKEIFNGKDNIYGHKCFVILISPSATEGIELYNVRQEHILDPHFNEVRIEQVIGRGIRQCSHKDLPVKERIVHVYRYKVTNPTDVKASKDQTTDEVVEDLAKRKSNLIESFLSPMKEAAVDCQLFRNHNMLNNEYTCFQFPYLDISQKNVGPAYMENIYDDVNYDSGLYASNSRVLKIKVNKIKGVMENDTTRVGDYLLDPESNIVYDFDLHFPIGYVKVINEIANKLDAKTYIITDTINVPKL